MDSLKRYSYSIRPKFYNITKLEEDQVSDLKAWIKWKNRMPRFTITLENVNIN